MIQDKISNLISNKTNIITENKKKRKKKLKFKFLKTKNQQSLDSRCLRFIQLLCSIHQNYLRYQFNFRKSYNLILITNQYLQQLYVNFTLAKRTFSAIIKCLDCLIEFIQGPCKENQNVLFNSKLISTMSEVLSNFLIEPSSLNKDEDMIEKSIITYKVIIKKII